MTPHRRRLQSNAGTDQRIAFVGTLSLDKGVHCLLAAYPAIAARISQARLTIIGDGVAREHLEHFMTALAQGGPQAAAPVLAAMPMRPPDRLWVAPVEAFWKQTDHSAYMAACRAQGMATGVTRTGHLDQPDVARVLARADLLVIPSLVKEAFPLVSLEALACGVPPLGCYRGGLVPILDEVAQALGPLGELVRIDPAPERMVADLADKAARLLEALAEPSARALVAKRCRMIAEQKYDWEQVVTRLEAVYASDVPRSSCDGRRRAARLKRRSASPP